MANNKISTSKKEIYTKLLDIAEKYTDIKNTDFLKTGLFGYITESMAMMMRDSTFHKSMLYNESFLNTAILPKSVYNWAKMFNIEVQKAIPKYAEINIIIPADSIVNGFLKPTLTDIDRKKYGFSLSTNINQYLILNKEDPIIAGDYTFSLEHSILIQRNESNGNALYTAQYILSEYESTTFQELTRNNLIVVNDGDNIIIKARAYQYKRSTFVRQITSTSFLNKVQTFQFPDQFCGAKLFYEENGEYTEVALKYSDMEFSAAAKTAFYNLSDENEIELLFKVGTNYFMPAANTKLKLYIYSTKAAEAPAYFNGDALMVFSDSDLKSLPMVIQFNPTALIGGKNRPALSDIKKTIINEISTRNTITTKTDLDNYFSILTSLIEDINDGKVTFIKKRDDIIKRMYNAYLLLRDNVDDSLISETIDTSVLSSVVPTNTMTVKMTRDNNSSSLTSFNYNYPIFDEEGNGISDTYGVNNYYICPFNIFVTTTPTNFVKYIYNLTDSEASLSYSESTLINNEFASQYYIIPDRIRLYRGFDESSGYKASGEYSIIMTTTTNKPIGNCLNDPSQTSLSYDGNITLYGLTSKLILSKDNGEIEVYSESTDEGLYTTTFKLTVTVDDTEFYFDKSNIIGSVNENELYCNSIRLKSTISSTSPFSSSEKLILDLSEFKIDNIQTGIEFESNEDLKFYEQLDTIMESSIIFNTESDKNKYPIALTDVPLVHSSFFNDETSSSDKRDGFIKQLFTYINILKNNLDRLETSTFFNLKFYNTYGKSSMYYTDKTNINLDFEVVLATKEYFEDEVLKQEIKAYVRKLVDRMNEQKSLNISSLISSLSSTETYGKYIKYIKFIGLNGTFNQYIKKLADVRDDMYTPEWLNIDASCLKDNNEAGEGIYFSYEE